MLICPDCLTIIGFSHYLMNWEKIR
jgi:hypothetical protein